MEENTIYCGDSCKLLAEWKPGCVDLVFADPPYNIGYVYDEYRDDLSDNEFVRWCREWMTACSRVLKPSGSFYIAIGDDYAADLRIVGRQLGLHLRNWILWHYTFGQNTRAKFCRSHTHLLYFVKDPQRFTFNDHLLRYPSARHTEYQDLRADPKGRLPNDVWDDFPRVCGSFKERNGVHGCQLPEALLMRIVMAGSNPGEIVLDPFVGSGTTAVAAQRLGRRYVGIDLSQQYVELTQQRLAAAQKLDAQPPDESGWPTLHTEMLLQLYRETKVAVHNLLPNDVALRVIAASLSQRAGREYSVADVRQRFEQLAKTAVFPKLPNDTPFAPRDHVTAEGKRYKRLKTLVRGKRPRGDDASKGDAGLFLQAM